MGQYENHLKNNILHNQSQNSLLKVLQDVLLQLTFEIGS